MCKKNLVLGFMLMMLLVLSPILMAANQIVTSTANSGAETLRDAIADVGDGETITFNISGSDVVIISSELSPTKSMTINGYNNATGNNVTVQVTTPGSGGTASRIFHLNVSGKTFNFSNMTIKGGDVSDNASYGSWGGGIFFEAGTLTLDSVTISGSRADQGGGIYNRNTSPTLTNCTISDNISDVYGGGIYNHGEVGASSPTLTNCTISGNSAVTYGGGVYTSGIISGISSPTLTNCTISGNSAGSGGGMFNYGSYCSPTLTNCTISGNSGSNWTGGVHNDWSGLHIKNTIIANNSGSYADFYTKDASAITDNGYNLVENSHNWNWSATGDIYGEQANLNLRSTLDDNGTLNGTQTLALYYGSVISVAVNAGSNVANNGVPIPTTDQRGAGRNGTTDIGAYEYWTGGDATLPITLSTFTAQYLNDTPTLCWTTQSETENMGWFVYRNYKEDFTTSEKVSEFLEGHGTTTQQQSYIYEDTIENPEIGDTYYYWLESIDYSGIVNHYDRAAILTIPHNSNSGNNVVPAPERFGLFQNEPNPFVFSTSIAFNLTETAQVDLNVYNLKGQLVKTLYTGVTSKHTVMWDGKDEQGKELVNGVYFYRLNINGKTDSTKKLILMR